MRSRVAIAALLWLTALPTLPAAFPTRDSSSAPTAAQIAATVDVIRKDPNLGGEKKTRTLRWVRDDQPPPTQAPSWIIGLFEFLGQAGGLLLWIGGAVIAAFAAIWIYRLLRLHAPEENPPLIGRPNQIQDLDIRPASLPEDIAAAALSLISMGRAREALSLLYRGALSRAVHRFSVTIGASFTESEVLRAVSRSLDPQRGRYFADLVNAWRLAVYAGQQPSSDTLKALCADFGLLLDGATV